MRKCKDVQKLTDNRHLNLYHIDALDKEGKSFDYYFASRNDEKHIKLPTKEMKSEGIVIYAVTDEISPRLALIRQYRYPLDAYVYELPAGLINAGETAAQAAVREMKEETGLDFVEYTGGSPLYRRPFFMGPGFTDETSAAVYGTVSGQISDEDTESTEEIRIFLADKATVRRILETERVSLRGAYLMMHFLSSVGGPLTFLER